MIGRQVTRLNAATQEACRAFRATFVPLDPDGKARPLSLGSTSTYVAWAETIAASMYAVLDEAVGVLRGEFTDEQLRQATLDSMDIHDLPPSAELDALVRVARDLFGMRGAAVNLIDHDRLHMLAGTGVATFDMPRSESFCSITVRLGSALIIEDTRNDARVNSLPAVLHEKILFYAGYPIEAPNGQRIGALCLFDSQPHIFTPADESLLRELALRVQAELWSPRAIATR